MKCMNCGNEDIIQVFEEEVQCDHCGGVHIIDHFVCENCNMISRFVDDQFMEALVLPGIDLYQEVIDLLELDEDDIIAPDEDQSMNALIHRCLQCNTIAYEKKENLWHCPECGFEWEVIGSD